MARVFISYSKQDRGFAEMADRALRAASHDTWWDRDLTPRTSWPREIEQQLAAADAVLVIWTPSSVQSDWVGREAREAAASGKLVPGLFRSCKIPVEFNDIQYADLTGWAGQEAHDGWKTALLWIAQVRDGGAPPVHRRAAKGQQREQAAEAAGPAMDETSGIGQTIQKAREAELGTFAKDEIAEQLETRLPDALKSALRARIEARVFTREEYELFLRTFFPVGGWWSAKVARWRLGKAGRASYDTVLAVVHEIWREKIAEAMQNPANAVRFSKATVIFEDVQKALSDFIPPNLATSERENVLRLFQEAEMLNILERDPYWKSDRRPMRDLRDALNRNAANASGRDFRSKRQREDDQLTIAIARKHVNLLRQTARR